MADPLNVIERAQQEQQRTAIEADAASNALLKARIKTGEISNEQFDAEFLGQEKIGPPGDPGLRFFLSLLGDTPEEQDAALKLLDPQAEVRRVPVTGDIVFRMNPEEDFRQLDRGFFENLGLAGESLKNLPEVSEEFLADLADFAGDAPEIAAEAAALFIGRSPGGGKFLSDLVRLGLGGATGEAAQQFAQTGVGTQRQTGEQQKGLVAGAVGESIIGGTIGTALISTLNAVRGRGILSLRPEGTAAVAAAERIGTSVPLPQQVTDVPAVRLLGRQSQALLPTIQRYLTNQEKRTASALIAQIDEKGKNEVIAEIFRAQTRANKDVVDAVIENADIIPRKKRAGGRALQQGIQAWWRGSGKDVDDLYGIVRSIEEPVYDLTKGVTDDGLSLLEVVGKIERGVVGPSAKGETFNVRVLDGELRAAMDRIKQLDPNLTGGEGLANPFDVLKEIRGQIDDLTLVGPEGPRVKNRLASELKDAVVKTIESPVNDNPKFKKAFKVANRAAADRFKRREQLAVIEAVRTQEPSTLVPNLAQPGQLDNLVAMRRALPEKEFERFRDAVATDLLNDPANLKTRLDAFDDETLNLLMSKPRQQVFKEAAEKFDRINDPLIQEALRKQTRAEAFMSQILSTGDSSKIDALGLLMKRGGRETTNSVRAGIINDIWKRSQVVEEGVARVDFRKLQSTLDEFEKTGVLDLLTDQQVRFLRDVEIVQDFSRFGVKDAGTSLQAAEAVAETREIVRGGGLSGITTIIEAYTVGRALTNEVVIKALIGTRGKPFDTRIARIAGAAAAQLNQDIEAQQSQGDAILSRIEKLARLPGRLTEPLFPDS